MKLLPYLFAFALGFGLCLWLSTKGCFGSTKDVQYVNTVEYKFKDTVIVKTKRVPVYISVETEKTNLDPLVIEKFIDVYHVDTTYIDTSFNMIVNTYRDTVRAKDFSFNYTLETLGYLTKFDSEVSINKDSTVRTITQLKKPRFCAQVGLSNLLHPKVGLGYRGWILEAEFGPIDKPRFNQIFLTKQFTFR
jgi:hypothetical protein